MATGTIQLHNLPLWVPLVTARDTNTSKAACTGACPSKGLIRAVLHYRPASPPSCRIGLGTWVITCPYPCNAVPAAIKKERRYLGLRDTSVRFHTLATLFFLCLAIQVLRSAV